MYPLFYFFTFHIEDGTQRPLNADVLHTGDNLLVGDKDLPDTGLIALLDGAVHPLHEAADESVVEVHLHVDVVVVRIQLGWGGKVQSVRGNGEIQGVRDGRRYIVLKVGEVQGVRNGRRYIVLKVGEVQGVRDGRRYIVLKVGGYKVLGMGGGTLC